MQYTANYRSNPTENIVHATLMFHAMGDIPYLRIRVIYVLHLCAVGFALRNIF